jgi:hypothetical protein
MSDKEDVTIRAARAEQLLQDEVFNEAMDSVLDQALSAALRAVLSDPTECVAAIANLQASHYLQEILRSFVTAGKAAERKPYKVA